MVFVSVGTQKQQFTIRIMTFSKENFLKTCQRAKELIDVHHH